MPVPRITVDELKKRLDGDPNTRPIIVDVRLKYPYEHSTVILPGARRLGAGTVDSAQLPRDREIVLYDSDPDELVSARAAADLIRRGHRAWVLTGGIAAWMAAKLPTDPKSAPLPSAVAPGALKG
jgi:rhodanese-related sulfurtransferase